MRSSKSSDIPDSHAVTVAVLRIAASVVVVVGILVVVAYFALGRPDAIFAGGSFPQLVSGAKSLSAGMPAPDPLVVNPARRRHCGGHRIRRRDRRDRRLGRVAVAATALRK